MITVYFDTNFYINLGRADDAEAASAIDSLNDLAVRIVASQPLVRELASNDRFLAADHILVSRLSGLVLQPLQLGPVGFGVLLESAETRTREASRLRAIREEMTVASALAATARLGNDADVEQLAAAYPDSAALITAAKDQNQSAFLAELRIQLAPALAEFGIPWPEGYDDDPAGLSSALMTALRSAKGDAAVEAIHREHAAQDSVLKMKRDGRLASVALGKPKYVPKMSGEFGDAEHIGVFLQHRDEIDLFQMDRRQYDPMLRYSRHELRTQGLADRCFAAPDLPTAIQQVERLVGLPR